MLQASMSEAMYEEGQSAPPDMVVIKQEGMTAASAVMMPINTNARMGERK